MGPEILFFWSKTIHKQHINKQELWIMLSGDAPQTWLHVFWPFSLTNPDRAREFERKKTKGNSDSNTTKSPPPTNMFLPWSAWHSRITCCLWHAIFPVLETYPIPPSLIELDVPATNPRGGSEKKSRQSVGKTWNETPTKSRTLLSTIVWCCQHYICKLPPQECNLRNNCWFPTEETWIEWNWIELKSFCFVKFHWWSKHTRPILSKKSQVFCPEGIPPPQICGTLLQNFCFVKQALAPSHWRTIWSLQTGGGIWGVAIASKLPCPPIGSWDFCKRIWKVSLNKTFGIYKMWHPELTWMGPVYGQRVWGLVSGKTDCHLDVP